MFALSTQSNRNLAGVHPTLCTIVRRAIEISTVDFGVLDGLREPEDQKALVESGASWTMKSKHLRQVSGHGEAVDLVPYVAGRYRWEWRPIYQVAAAMKQAAEEASADIRWGGAWQLLGELEDPKAAVHAYILKCFDAGKEPKLDGPHYELRYQ